MIFSAPLACVRRDEYITSEGSSYNPIIQEPFPRDQNCIQGRFFHPHINSERTTHPSSESRHHRGPHGSREDEGFPVCEASSAGTHPSHQHKADQFYPSNHWWWHRCKWCPIWTNFCSVWWKLYAAPWQHNLVYHNYYDSFLWFCYALSRQGS